MVITQTMEKSDANPARTSTSGAKTRGRRGQTPMYQILKSDLERAIKDGHLKPGELVPSESELIARYHVSSTTARRCLDELENEGFLERKRGKGTFVSGMANVLNKQRVAIVIKDLFSLAHPFLATVVGTIEHTLESAGVHVVISRAKASAEANDDGAALYDIIEHEGARYALILSNMPLRLVRGLVDRGIHCLGVNTRYLDPRIPNVSMDFEANFSTGIQALTDRGHRNIAIFTHEPPMKELGVMNSASLLHEVYQKSRILHPSLTEHPEIYQVRANGDLAEFVERALLSTPRPTAFMCWDELAALDVMRILSEKRVRVPQDVSVIGSRLLPASPIACIDTPLAAMAKRAAEMMLLWLNGRKPENELFRPIGFLDRETIGPANASFRL